jgi:hypothetical protein
VILSGTGIYRIVIVLRFRSSDACEEAGSSVGG